MSFKTAHIQPTLSPHSSHIRGTSDRDQIDTLAIENRRDVGAKRDRRTEARTGLSPPAQASKSGAFIQYPLGHGGDKY